MLVTICNLIFIRYYFKGELLIRVKELYKTGSKQELMQRNKTQHVSTPVYVRHHPYVSPNCPNFFGNYKSSMDRIVSTTMYFDSLDDRFETGDLMLVKYVGENCTLVKNRYVGEELCMLVKKFHQHSYP